MVKKARELRKLEQVARIKAELELKKFAAFSAHVTAARDRVEGARVALTQCYDATAPLDVAEARAANVQAGRSARDIARAEADLTRMLPRFEVARQAAAREFGRAEALYDLSLKALRPPPGRGA